jgi:hypothetical protein
MGHGLCVDTLRFQYNSIGNSIMHSNESFVPLLYSTRSSIRRPVLTSMTAELLLIFGR